MLIVGNLLAPIGRSFTPLHPTSVHHDVIEWKHFQHYWTFVRGIHRSSVNSPYKGQWCFDVFFDRPLNKRLGKQSWGWWFETPSRSLWRHCNDYNTRSRETGVRCSELDCITIWQASQQHCCQYACQTSYTQWRGFETSRDLVVRPHTTCWIKTLVLIDIDYITMA